MIVVEILALLAGISAILGGTYAFIRVINLRLRKLTHEEELKEKQIEMLEHWGDK